MIFCWALASGNKSNGGSAVVYSRIPAVFLRSAYDMLGCGFTFPLYQKKGCAIIKKTIYMEAW